MCHVPVNAVYLLLTAWSGLLGGVKSITTWQYSNRWRTLCPELSSLQSSYSEYSTLGPPCHWVTALTLVRPIFILTGWDFKALSLPLMREGFSGTQFVRFSQNLLTFPSNILHGSPQSLVLMTNGLCPQPALSRLPRGTTGHNTFYTEYQEKNNNWRP